MLGPGTFRGLVGSRSPALQYLSTVHRTSRAKVEKNGSSCFILHAQVYREFSVVCPSSIWFYIIILLLGVSSAFERTKKFVLGLISYWDIAFSVSIAKEGYIYIYIYIYRYIIYIVLESIPWSWYTHIIIIITIN